MKTKKSLISYSLEFLAKKREETRKRNDLRKIRLAKNPGQGSADVIGFKFQNLNHEGLPEKLQDRLIWGPNGCATKSRTLAKVLVKEYSAQLI